MLISFALSFIGVIIIFANNKLLRNYRVLMAFLVPLFLLAAAGVYILLNGKTENPFILMMMISPFVALVLLELCRFCYKRLRHGQEIILSLGGFLPGRSEERFVSRLEKFFTFVMTAAAVVLPYLIVLWLRR